MIKRKPRPRTRKPGPQTDYEDARDAVRYDPARYEWGMAELERMAKGESEYGQLPPALKILCIKEILTYEGVPAAVRFRADAGIAGDTNITIQIASWAAAKPAPALPVPIETIIEPDAPRTSSSPPTPALSDRDRVLAQAQAARETVVYEAPVSPSEQPREIARVSQAKGIVQPGAKAPTRPLTLEEKLRNKGVGVPRETAPETTVRSNFDLFRGGE